MRPLLSIVVPTKNRYHCLRVLVELFSMYNDKDVELVISDNSDDNTEFTDYLEKLDNPNIKYIYTNQWLSVCENADRGILASCGEYVNLIGDDDGYQPQIVDATRTLKLKGGESLNCYRCQYYWPGITSTIFNYDSSLIIKKRLDTVFHLVDVNKELSYVLRTGASVSYYKLPCVYNGIVSRETLNKIFAQCGTFFPGPSPDMANAVALGTIIRKHYWVNYPLSWAGKNTNSASGMGLRHMHANRIDQAKWLPKDSVANWDKRLPYYWTVSTIWGDSAIEALRRMSKLELLKKFNFSYLYGRFLALNLKNRRELNNLIKADMIASIIISYIVCYCQRTKMFLRNYSLNRFGRSWSYRKINGVEDVIKCTTLIKDNYPMTTMLKGVSRIGGGKRLIIRILPSLYDNSAQNPWLSTRLGIAC